MSNSSNRFDTPTANGGATPTGEVAASEEVRAFGRVIAAAIPPADWVRVSGGAFGNDLTNPGTVGEPTICSRNMGDNMEQDDTRLVERDF
ncbi:hypothetical protein BURK2_02401 [Burkholderiales bacterium]|nr:MAG: hypothetical protein F9K47_13425 [Burkholderiales bacterium]CAG0991278.1 hypothetical protein BURK2_02401 [Burkholderiales bacterium]